MSLTSYFMLEDFVSMPQCSQVDPRMVPVMSHHQQQGPPVGHVGMSNSAVMHPHLIPYANTSYVYSSHPPSDSTVPASYNSGPHQGAAFNTAYSKEFSAPSEDTSSSKTEFLDFGPSCARGQVVQCPATSTTSAPERRKGVKPKSDGVVAKRNARERRRVQAVNGAFSKLRKHIPYENRNKRLSKVKTLKIAIEYIHCLQDLLHRVDLGDLRQTSMIKTEQSGV